MGNVSIRRGPCEPNKCPPHIIRKILETAFPEVVIANALKPLEDKW